MRSFASICVTLHCKNVVNRHATSFVVTKDNFNMESITMDLPFSHSYRLALYDFTQITNIFMELK